MKNLEPIWTLTAVVFDILRLTVFVLPYSDFQNPKYSAPLAGEEARETIV